MHASKICIKLCFTYVGRTQSLHCQASGWQDMKAMPLNLSLPPSLSHIFGTIIPLFNWAVWSCFTPVHPHWLPFCPISPPLMRLSVISNDRQKMAGHIGALVPPWCQRCSSAPHSSTCGRLSEPSCIVSLLSAQSNAKVVGFHSLWLTQGAPQWPRVAHMHNQPKEGSHTIETLWKGVNKEISKRERLCCWITANKISWEQGPS